jgi:5-methylcytosine-specific restriction protein A
MHPFIIGYEYERSSLLKFVGSRQLQTGVIWGEREPGCTIVTTGGRHGRKVGYFDEKYPDGSWRYFGQGQSGDHLKSNPANKRLLSAKHTVLLFLTREPTAAEIKFKGNYRKSFNFQGAFNVYGFEVVTPDSGARAGDNLLRFQLIPISHELYFHDVENTAGDIIALRNQLSSPGYPGNSQPGFTVAWYRQRSRELRRYAILRSLGRCEGCGAPAPFVNDRGQGFLEVHHITRLADDGIDEPENVAAVCPNCHRRAHYSSDREDFKKRLLEAAKTAERRVYALAPSTAESGASSQTGKKEEKTSVL